MIIEYARTALDGLRRDMPKATTKTPWYYTVAAQLQLEPIRNRDRPKIEFAKGVRFRRAGRKTVLA